MTPSISPPLQTISAFTQYKGSRYRRDSLMNPTIPLQTSFTFTPLYTTPAPPPQKRIVHYSRLARLPVQAIIVFPLSKDISTRTLFEKINRCVTYRKNPWILLDSVAPQGATLSKNKVVFRKLCQIFRGTYRVTQLLNSLEKSNTTTVAVVLTYSSSLKS